MKFMKYFTLLAAAAGLVSACTTDLEHVQTLPDGEVVAPVLHELAVSEVVITSQNQSEVLAIEWDAAYFGEQINPTYTLYVSNVEREVAVITGLTENKVELKYEQLNIAVARPVDENGLGLEIGVASDINLRVGARVGTNGKIFYTDYAALKVTPASFEKTYPMLYMPGSYQNWNPGNAATNYQVLYSFANNTVFEGIADFGKADDASRAWKFTKEPNWDFDWGVPKGQEQAAEAATLTLINNDGGDREDIKAYTVKRFYHFTMDTASGELKNNYSFNQVGVVGDFNGWGNEAEMQFNAYKRRFYIDVENLSGGFKFRADAAWDLNWGLTDGKLGNGGDNITAEAGNYRVYLYLSDSNDVRYELDAKMFGQEEPLAPATTPDTPDTPDTPAEKEPNRWGIVGTPNEWSKDGALPDLYMDEVGENVYVRRSLPLTTADEFKIRFNDEWNNAKNYGLEADGVVEPNVGFAVITSGESKNIKISAEGTYDVYFDVTAEKVWIMTEGEIPSDVTMKSVKLYVDVTATGWTNCNIWAWDDANVNYTGGTWPGQALESKDGKYVWEAPAEAVGKTISVIFNNGSEQTADITDVVLDQDHTFVLNADKSWTMDGVQPEPEPEVVTFYIDVTATGWTNCNIWAWDDANVNYTGGTWPGQALEMKDGKYVWVVPAEAVGKTISVIFNNGSEQTADITGIDASKNHSFVVAADKKVTIDDVQPEPEVVTFYIDVTATGWTNCNIWAWGDGNVNYTGGTWPGQALEMKDGKYVWVVPAEAVGKTISVIFNNGSEQTADITGIDAGKNHSFVVAADKKVTIDDASSILTFTDYAWALAGTFNQWGNLEMTVADGWATATVDFAAGAQFKVKATSTWDVSFGHSEDGKNVVVGSEFEVAFNGRNMLVENAGKYNVAFTIVDGKAKMKVELAN